MQTVTTIILDIVKLVFQAHRNDAVGCETADFGIWPILLKKAAVATQRYQ